MQGFYKILDTIKAQLKSDPFVNTVTTGDIFNIDLEKQTIYPLSHIIVNSCDLDGPALKFNISVLAMDIVDKSSDLTVDVFTGNDNEQDVLNTQLAVLVRLVEVLRKGRLNDNLFQLDGGASFEPFMERFENYLAGQTVTFDVIVPHDMTSCELPVIPTDVCLNSIIVNTSGSFNVEVASGDTYVLEDTTYNIYVNGELDQTFTEPSMEDININITA